MKRHKIKFWILYHFGLIVFSIGSGMLMKIYQTGNALHPTVIVPIVVIFLVSVSIGHLVIFTVNKAKKYTQSQINKMIIPAVLIFYAAAFLIANLAVLVSVLGWYIYTGTSLKGFWAHMLHQELNHASGSLFLWLMFFTIAFFYILWQKSIKKEQKLLEENLKYRYNSLKLQVNPHFLFNSLNTLSELVYEDPKKADHYIQTLSDIYRYVLENEETELIELEKELEFVQNYFHLQQVRDEGKILMEIDIKHSKGIKIIPVSLQLLVENALKHNTKSKEKPLKIRISLRNENIVVSNPIQKKTILESSTQIGLSNLNDRTKIMLGKELEISHENNSFTVQLPIQKL